MPRHLNAFAKTLFAAALFLFSLPGAGNDVPPFTPNVVDSAGQLPADAVAEINQTLELIREKADIWGAVYIVQELKDDSIESLSERAFREWQLGQKGKDNGLLLVLSMNDRKSRFEVGYGLEGDLPDVIARHALNQVLRPYMREGDVKNAVIKSFTYLAGLKSKNPAFALNAAPKPSIEKRFSIPDELDMRRGWTGLLFFYFCLWFLRPLATLKALARARRLELDYPSYRVGADPNLNFGKLSLRHLFLGDVVVRSLFSRIFFSLNPGIFIFFGSAAHLIGLAAVILLVTPVAGLYFRSLNRKRKDMSRKDFEAYVDSMWKQNQRLMERGYLREKSPGHFEYTPAWYSSTEYQSSRSSSSRSSSSSGRSRSSSSSSSSGGGRSGGGGASSSW